MPDRINILHLRASEGGGGGPEKTIFKTARHIDTDRFWYGTCYLRKKDTNLTTVASRYRQSGLPYFELPGGVLDHRQLKSIISLIKRHQVHILHTHDAKSIVYGVILKCRFPKLKLVTTLHGWIIRRQRSRWYQWISEISLWFFDAVIAVSGDLEQKIRQKGIRRVIRIHNAIDPAEWRPRHGTERRSGRQFTVGFIGRISREKGPEQFLRIARLLAGIDADIHFRMVGEGPMNTWVKAEVKRLGLQERVTHTDHVPQAEMPGVYHGLDALLSSSHTEGMPNTLLEAFACGVPVVATRVGGVEELVSDRYNGILARDGDTLALAHGILAIKQQPLLAEQFRRNAKARIMEDFSFLKRVSAIERLYLTLARKGRIQ